MSCCDLLKKCQALRSLLCLFSSCKSIPLSGSWKQPHKPKEGQSFHISRTAVGCYKKKVQYTHFIKVVLQPMPSALAILRDKFELALYLINISGSISSALVGPAYRYKIAFALSYQKKICSSVPYWQSVNL